MKNLNVLVDNIITCVWCGVAFLRTPGAKAWLNLQAEQEIVSSGSMGSPRANARGFDSFGPHHFWTLRLTALQGSGLTNATR